jgi:hypothetical protein
VFLDIINLPVLILTEVSFLFYRISNFGPSILTEPLELTQHPQVYFLKIDFIIIIIIIIIITITIMYCNWVFTRRQ